MNEPRIGAMISTLNHHSYSFQFRGSITANRANLTIIAFQGQEISDVDVSSFMKMDDKFELRDPKQRLKIRAGPV